VVVDPQSAEVVIVVETSEHMSDVRVELVETDRAVTITASVDWNPPKGGWFVYYDCRRVVVSLSRALGERRLLGQTVDGERGPRLEADPGPPPPE
jgi:hypothetical protein